MINKFIKNHSVKIYAFIIITFALVYWCNWLTDSDSFIQNQELNLNPSQVLDDILDERTDTKKIGVITKSLSSLQQNVNDLQVQFVNAKTIEKNLNELLSKYEIARKKTSESLEKLWGQNVEEYVRTKSKETTNEIMKLEKNLATLEDTKTSTIEDINKTHNIRINILNLEIKRSEETVSSLNYTLQHANEFHDANTLTEFKIEDEKTQKIRKQLIDNNSKLVDIRLKALELKKDKNSNLSFADFFFYSIGIATTTTFGDIVANNKWIRFLACIQLIFCIYILSVTISKFSKD